MIQRIFHPIGQGAFYSERHDNVNIVYDCGNLKNTKLADKVVKQSFNPNDEIDILFISHFDFDHISKIPTLVKHVKRVKNVVMPLLHNNEKILLTNYYRGLGFNILSLLTNPKSFFGDRTKIIYIKPADSEQTENLTSNNEPIILDEIENLEIESGKKLTLNSLPNWVFIPYNYEYNKNYNNLINELRNEGFNTTKLTHDSKYTLDKIVKDISISKAKGGKILKKIYDKLNGKINQNSMFLYSGPIRNNKYNKHCFLGDMHKHFYYHLFYHYDNFDKVACIYTGDGNLNVVDIKSVYKSYWKNVGTIQIPHHGDNNSFNMNFLKNGGYYCPISFGINNSYGHPSSQVIAQILSKNSYPILVTEKLDSTFVEIIR